MRDNNPELAGFRRLISRKGVVFTMLDNSPPNDRTFTGLLAVNPPIDPRLDLNADPREAAIIETESTGIPTVLMKSDSRLNHRLKDEAGNTWNTIRREDNPADFTTRFWVVKITPQDK